MKAVDGWCVGVPDLMGYVPKYCCHREIPENKEVTMKVICISGKAQHGKDTTAGFMKEFFEERGKKVLIAHYGDLVKYVCKTFFDWDGQKDEKGRTILQYVGTDVIRTRKPNYWVRFISEMLTFFADQWDYVLIPDCRFPNEIEYLQSIGHDHDVTHIRVVRDNFVSPLTEKQQKHPSETALDGYPYDFMLLNSRDLEWHRTTCRSLAEAFIAENGEFTEADAIKFWGEADTNG